MQLPIVQGEFEAIYRAELGYVWSSLRRLAVPPRDLEDLAHEVFTVVYRRLSEFDRSRPVRPWLFGIAFRVAAKHQRKSSTRREVLDEAVEVADPAASAEQALEAEERRRMVIDAMAEMSLDQRAVFAMHEIDGRAAPEIAEALSIPINTVYSRLRLGRQKFAAAIAARKEQS